ncbi:MAG: hypothetical protein Q8O55_10260, partial [Dehalococcoidales bacterium]|nr:hypothetical protein [Dehalococcoidales bacterium]
PNGDRVESITAYGKYWNWDNAAGTGTWIPFVDGKNGSDLTSEPRYGGTAGPSVAPVTVASATLNGQSLDLSGGTTLSTTLALPSGATSVDVPVIINYSSGSPRNLIIRFTYQPPAAVSPTASLTGPNSGTVGQNLTFTASLTNAQSGQIWITKGDGKSTFSCPQGPGGAPYQASTGFFWCPVAKQDNTTSLSGAYTFAEPGSFTAVVNAFASSNQTGTGPQDQCSGTPSSFGFNPAIWSDCGSGSRLTIAAAAIGPCTGKAPGTCTFDTQAVWYNSDGTRGQSIIIGGSYWNYSSPTPGVWNLTGSGDLATVPVYTAAGGPCAGKAPGTCTFDTQAVWYN